MIEPGSQNHPQNCSICLMPSPLWNLDKDIIILKSQIIFAAYFTLTIMSAPQAAKKK